jgi:hypothetical protein
MGMELDGAATFGNSWATGIIIGDSDQTYDWPGHVVYPNFQNNNPPYYQPGAPSYNSYPPQ